jgi:RNA polymerase sigma-70 factor (ECF subfamily)
MTNRPAVAEELLQETWMRLARNASRLAEDTDLGAWLFTVARNLARDHARAQRSSPVRATDVDAVEQVDAGASPFEWASASETNARLTDALAALAPRDREVLLLVAVEDLAQDRVAHILGIGHDAVRQRVARARARLLALLERAPLRAASHADKPEDKDDARH